MRRPSQVLVLEQAEPHHIRDVELFHGFDEATLQVTGKLCQPIRVDAGGFVIREHDTSEFLFLVRMGELEVMKASDKGVEVRVAMLGSHDWFGEVAFFSDKERSASVRALAPSLLYKVRAKDLEKSLQESAPKMYGVLMKNLAQALSRRLSVADRVVAQVVERISFDYVTARSPNAGKR